MNIFNIFLCNGCNKPCWAPLRLNENLKSVILCLTTNSPGRPPRLFPRCLIPEPFQRAWECVPCSRIPKHSLRDPVFANNLVQTFAGHCYLFSVVSGIDEKLCDLYWPFLWQQFVATYSILFSYLFISLKHWGLNSSPFQVLHKLWTFTEFHINALLKRDGNNIIRLLQYLMKEKKLGLVKREILDKGGKVTEWVEGVIDVLNRKLFIVRESRA